MRNGGDIMHVPYRLLDEDILKVALELKQDLNSFPEHMLTREICMNAVLNKHKLSYIP